MQPVMKNRTPVPWGGILALAGASLTLVALFLPWLGVRLADFGELFAELDLGDVTANGLNSGAGILRLILVLGALSLSVVAILLRTPIVRRGVAIALIPVGALLFVLVVIEFVDLAGATLRVGAYLALAASPMVVIGGILGLAEAKHLEGNATGRIPVAPPPPPG